MIRVIRESDDPKADLMAAFDLTEMQADDILEIRLRQLARLESIKIEKELKELMSERDELNRILGDGKALTSLVIDEIRADMKKYGDDRRTRIEAAQSVTASTTSEASIVDEPVTVIVSLNGWLRTRQGHGVDRASIQYKAGDGEMAVHRNPDGESAHPHGQQRPNIYASHHRFALRSRRRDSVHQSR